MLNVKLYIFLLCFGIGFSLQAQQWHTDNLNQLDELLSKEKYKEAHVLLKKNTAALQAKKSYYLLTDYIYYTGKIANHSQNQFQATTTTKEFVKTITKATDSLKVLRQIQLELSTYYTFIGDLQKAYETNLEAKILTKKWKEATPEDFGLIENNLATLANRNGAIADGIKHSKKALQYYESYPKTKKKNLYHLQYFRWFHVV